MTNLKRVFLTMLVIILLGATVVLATTDGTIVIGGEDEVENTVVENTVNNVNTVNDVNLVGNTTINTTTTNNTNTSNYNVTQNLPQTGANDYIMVLVIGVFAVSAVYAYKKIRDYKSI